MSNFKNDKGSYEAKIEFLENIFNFAAKSQEGMGY